MAWPVKTVHMLDSRRALLEGIYIQLGFEILVIVTNLGHNGKIQFLLHFMCLYFVELPKLAVKIPTLYIVLSEFCVVIDHTTLIHCIAWLISLTCNLACLGISVNGF